MWHSELSVPELGKFTLRKSHASWSRALLLGALDYYSLDDIDAYQIVPEQNHWTIDVPNMAKAKSRSSEPMWSAHDDWRHAVPADSEVMTNLDALRGATITEVARWEEDYWEMFAGSGSEVPTAEGRLVSLGMLIAGDPSLAPAAELAVGETLWRDDQKGAWHRSKSKPTKD